MKKGIRNFCCLILVAIIILIVPGMVLSACSSRTTMTTTVTTTATITVPTTGTTQFVFPDEGIIRLGGEGYFNFQQVSQPVSEAINFHGVIFSPSSPEPGTTITGPISYRFIAQFADGTTEQLSHVGLGDLNIIDINLTQHNDPTAGVMLAWQVIDGSLHPVIYFLVSE